MLLAGTLALLCALLGRNPVVHASCVGPPLALVWSYPEAGAEQVPTNITIWAVTSLWGSRPAATLDGNPVEMQGAPSFSGVFMQPQSLTPNSSHTLVLDYSRSPNLPTPGAPARFEITFKTGAGPSETTVAVPSVTGSVRAVAEPSMHDCADVVAAQDCFDTGQDTLLSLEVKEVQPDATLGWLLHTDYQGSSAIWPARCGAPSVYLHKLQSLCFDVQRIGAGGRLSEAVEYCSAPTAPTADMTVAAGHGGASSAGTGGGSLSAPAPDASREDAVARHDPAHAGSAGLTAGERAAAEPPRGNTGCSTVSGARTAARAFWAVVVIALLFAHSQRQRRRRPRGVTPSRRFRM